MQILKRAVPLPQEAMIERVYFKYNYKKFVVQYYPSRPEEKTLWAIRLKDGTPYYLGKYVNGELITPTYGELCKHHDYLMIKGADRLYRFVEFSESSVGSSIK